MQLKKLLSVLLLWSVFQLSAQEDLFTGSGLFKGDVQGNLNVYSISTPGGEDDVDIDYKNIQIRGYKGSPLLLYRWAKAEVLFNDGKFYKIPYVNYDALSDQFVVYLKDFKGEIKGMANDKFPLIALNKKSIVSISLKNENEHKKFIHLTPVRFLEEPKSEFFEYFSEHPKDAYVLKSYYKKITQNRLKAVPYTDSPETYAFKTYIRYYILNKDKTYVSTNLSKKNVLSALGDKAREAELKKYIKKNKLRLSRPEDVQKLLEYYFKEQK